MNLWPSGRRGWRAVRAIARRDLLEFVRDRRTLFVTLLMPMAMYPVLALSSLLGVRASLDDQAAGPPSRLVLAVTGPDDVPLVARVRQLAPRAAPAGDWPQQLEIEAVTFEDARRLHEAGGLDAWIDLPAGTLAALDGTGTVRFEVRLPTIAPPGGRVREQVGAILASLAADARLRRLAAAGLPASMLDPVAFEFVGGGPPGDTSAARSVVPIAAGAVLVLLALLMATGAFYPAIDAIAGEKERGTIETLLMAPCGPADLVFGKFLAVLAVTLLTLAANAVSISLTLAVLLRFLPAEARAGLTPATLAPAVAIALPAFVGLAAVAAALSIAVTAASRSVKEAQNTLTPVIVLVSGLAGAALMPGVADQPWAAALPFTGQVAVSRAVLLGTESRGPVREGLTGSAREAAGEGGQERGQERGDGLPLTGLAISLGSSLLVTRLLLRVTGAVVTDEELLFRGPDTAAAGMSRPPARPRPTPRQGLLAALTGFAALWYAQGLAPADLSLAIPIQQFVSVVAPLLLLSWWQRVDPVRTFFLHPPAADPLRGAAAAGGALCAGAGLFVLGAAALLAVRGGGLSPGAEGLSRRLAAFLLEMPWWWSLTLCGLLPAVCEELFFRGWMLAAFAGDSRRRGVRVGAIVGQAALFALFHLLPERMPQTFALGLVCGWMTLRCRSIVPALAAHVAHNSVPLALVAWAGGEVVPNAVAPLRPQLPGWAIAAAALGLGGGLAALVAATRHPPEARRDPRPAGPEGPIGPPGGR